MGMIRAVLSRLSTLIAWIVFTQRTADCADVPQMTRNPQGPRMRANKRE
jgi:hypothetical protein